MMVNKLKKKFTALATVSMLILMTVLLLIMNLVNYTSVVKECDTILDVLSRPDINFTDDKVPFEKHDKDFRKDIPHGVSPEVPYESRYFTAVITQDGEIVSSNLTRIISVDSDSVKEYVAKAVSKKDTRGFVGSFRYLKQVNDEEIKIIFLDCSRTIDAFYTFLFVSSGVGFLGCVVVFFAFLFASGKIIRPISEAYEKQKRFISDAGHEIKTPLTIINANVDLLMCDDESEELEEIRNQTKRLTELTNNLVYLSKMEESENVIQRVEMPLSDIITETVNSFNVLALAKNISLLQNVKQNISYNGSPDAIRQLTSILLENAIKYSPKSENVEVNLSSNKKSAILSVVNTTEGSIEKDSLSYVFDRFYRTDTSRNSSTGGHGIGLSIAKAITDAHRGNITATTTSGNDFCVTVELPF